MYLDNKLVESQYQKLFITNPLSQSFDISTDKDVIQEWDFISYQPNRNNNCEESFDLLLFPDNLEENDDFRYFPNWL